MDINTLTSLYRKHIDQLTALYADALTAAGFDGLVIHSGSLQLRSLVDDQYWPLRPTPYFQHWVPVCQPDCAIVYVVGKAPTFVWTRATSMWELAPQPETDHFTHGIAIVEPQGEGGVKALLPTAGKIAFLGDNQAIAAAWGFDGDRINPKELIAALDPLRTRKTDYEIACIAEANRRAAVGHRAVFKAFSSSDRSELDLHLLYLAATGQDDPETPYKNIVALGPHAAVLHHIAYDKWARSRNLESLLLDAGASYQGYTSDITRTWVKGHGATTSAYRGLIDGVEKMQQRLCAGIQLGTGYEALHDESHRQVAGILRTVGLGRGSIDELVDTGITRAFYPHGLGHSLGLQVHDVGCATVRPKPENPFLRNTSTIEGRQVFTVEPGIYFISAILEPLRQGPHAGLIDFRLVDELAPLGGVRIEDDVAVLENAEPKKAPVRNLTREHLPLGGGYAEALG
ncbi:Xaa-Pro dipeptidase [Pendulispora albinea]|uniref:Xaa-Pro dipeptidase n=1 Tax=Pendulispora albinea TaxID=2741071 RepID=A0ABZ2M1T3_9BACT